MRSSPAGSRWRPVPRTSIASRSGSQPATLGAPGQLLAEDGEARDLARLPPCALAISTRASSSRSAPWTAARRRAASSEPESSALGLVDSTRLTQRSTTAPSRRSPCAEVEHRRLGQAADDLVGRGDDEVGAAAEGVRREVGVEVEVGAPGLVDDQRQVALVGDRGEAGEIGAGAEVGRRDDHRGDRVGDASSAAASASGVRQCAIPSSGSSSGATNAGRRPLITIPSITEEWTLRWTTTSRRCGRGRGRWRGCPARRR